jgi:carbamoyltransferase
MLRMAKYAHKLIGTDYLTLAGGVALNCVGNGRILRESPFKNIWIQPAAGDAGGALGAALFTWYQYLENSRSADGKDDFQNGSFLGPEFRDEEIFRFLDRKNISYTKLNEENLPARIADLIASEKVVGWLQGRMEFGPRALGARSILGDARSPKMQETMNLKIKFRESFRPFAPSVLKENVSDYFGLDKESPYMLLVAPVNDSHKRAVSEDEKKLSGLAKLNSVRSDIPAVTHVDYSARVQTVNDKTNPIFYKTIKKFYEKYGCPVIINTSFNVRGEPIVATPQHAYTCFMRTNMDYLVMGRALLEKTSQKPLDKDIDWLKEYELD